MDDDVMYRKLLANIDGQLHEDDIKSLKFLCEPYMGTKKSSSHFTSGFDVFSALEKSNKLSERNLEYLCELLCIIGRVDLASLIDPNCDYSYIGYDFVDPFRAMLFKLSEDLGSEDLERLRYLYGRIPKKVVISDGIDLLSQMLQHKTLSPSDLGQLKSMLLEIDRHDLCDIISNFHASDPQGHSELTTCASFTEVTAVMESSHMSPLELNIVGEEEPPDLCMGNYNQLESITDNSSYSSILSPAEYVSHPVFSCKLEDFKECENIPVSLESAQAITHSDRQIDTAIAAATNQLLSLTNTPGDESYIPIEYYKMDAVPRGLCVVIDNRKFSPDLNDPEAIKTLGNREGSDKDSEALERSFKRLHFLVEVKVNLKDMEIIEYLKSISIKDHANYDCFVCCILSHGGESHVFGVNGRKVHLGDITSLFRVQSCPSLARKPKLFFMASCRGKIHQTAVQNPQVPFETDKPEIDFDSSEWVPNEADFLFGYSTVINHVSYRSKSQGTFYINELTRILDKYASRDDLQTLLLRVNDAVSEKIYSHDETVYKQTPAPQHTLRKQLKFL